MCRSRAQSLPVPTGANGEVSTQESIVPGLDFANHAVEHSCRWTVWGGRRVRLPCQPLFVCCAWPCGLSRLPCLVHPSTLSCESSFWTVG